MMAAAEVKPLSMGLDKKLLSMAPKRKIPSVSSIKPLVSEICGHQYQVKDSVLGLL